MALTPGAALGIRPLSPWMQGFLYATAALFLLTGVQLIALSGQTDTYFAWNLTPPLAAAFLGAPFFAAGVGQLIAARQKTWAAARLGVVWLFVISGAMLAITLLHVQDFHFSSSGAAPQAAAWFWGGMFAGVPVAALLVTWAQLRVPGVDPPRHRTLPRDLRTGLTVQIAMFGITGALCLLIPGIFLTAWTYPATNLAIQIIGAGLLGFAVLTYQACRERDLTRIRPLGGILTILGALELVVLALFAGEARWSSPMTWLTVVWMVSLLPIGTQALFGRKILRLRAEKAVEKPAQATAWGGAPSRGVALEGDRPWFRHWPGDVPRSIEYPEITVPEMMDRAAQQHPDRVAYRFFGAPMTYRECEKAIHRFAAGLRQLGIRPGDRVSVMLLTTPHFPIVLGGVLEAGGIIVQTNPLYTAHELERLYNASGVVAVVTMDLFWPTLAKVKPNTKVSQVVVCDMADFLRTPIRQIYRRRKRSGLKKAGHWPLEIPNEGWVHRFSDVVATPEEPGRSVPVGPGDVAVLQYTGGTTGVPRGAVLTHRNLVASVLQSVAWMGKMAETNRVTGAAAPFHVSGLTGGLQLWVAGDENLLAPDPRDFRYILKLAQKWRATLLAGPPAMYIAMLRLPDFAKYDLSSLKLGYSTSAPLPHEVRAEFERRVGCRLLSLYGLTEACPALGNPLNAPSRDDVGIPYPDTDARIADPDDPDKTVPSGEVGELAIRGPQVMGGYWNQPEETGLILRDGWLLTGDLASMGEDGRFHIVDRKKDMINAWGYKVYPAEVEDVLYMHPGIAEAAVIGVPDPDRGEAVKAFVVRKARATVTEQDLVAFCKEHLAPVKVPNRFEFVPDLPKSIVGKVLRRALRERGEAGARAAN